MALGWPLISPMKCCYTRRVLQQGLYAANVCPAPTLAGRLAAIFFSGMPWRRLFNLHVSRLFSDSLATSIVGITPSGMAAVIGGTFASAVT
jgi:hypothetical protein